MKHQCVKGFLKSPLLDIFKASSRLNSSVTGQKFDSILVTFGCYEQWASHERYNQDVWYVTGEHFVFIMLNSTTHLHCAQYKPFTKFIYFNDFIRFSKFKLLSSPRCRLCQNENMYGAFLTLLIQKMYQLGWTIFFMRK